MKPTVVPQKGLQGQGKEKRARRHESRERDKMSRAITARPVGRDWRATASVSPNKVLPNHQSIAMARRQSAPNSTYLRVFDFKKVVGRLTRKNLNHNILGRAGRLLQFITRGKKPVENGISMQSGNVSPLMRAKRAASGFAGTFPLRKS